MLMFFRERAGLIYVEPKPHAARLLLMILLGTRFQDLRPFERKELQRLNWGYTPPLPDHISKGPWPSMACNLEVNPGFTAVDRCPSHFQLGKVGAMPTNMTGVIKL